jgi:hypothetical protein
MIALGIACRIRWDARQEKAASKAGEKLQRQRK